ncbi:unnamed protein product [Gordionus sp. m RMFG-2023]|uniref:uncharacterized protein LOC135931328 isoform X2 n=1 Tax=Gordionus sp. m RMFG-2023 TaxID=3053472 RepID=UPI0030E5AEBE
MVLVNNGEHCDTALGMESEGIPNEWLSASSSHDAESVGPHNGRLNLDRDGGAWCPADGPLNSPDSFSSQQFLQINLPHPHTITAVETQGRFGNGNGQEFVEQFKLVYAITYPDGSRKGEESWIMYKDSAGNTILNGNNDTQTIRKTRLSPPITANKIRFIPYNLNPRTVCMRVEIRGCPFTDGIIPSTSEANPTFESNISGNLNNDGKNHKILIIILTCALLFFVINLSFIQVRRCYVKQKFAPKKVLYKFKAIPSIPTFTPSSHSTSNNVSNLPPPPLIDKHVDNRGHNTNQLQDKPLANEALLVQNHPTLRRILYPQASSASPASLTLSNPRGLVADLCCFDNHTFVPSPYLDVKNGAGSGRHQQAYPRICADSSGSSPSATTRSSSNSTVSTSATSKVDSGTDSRGKREETMTKKIPLMGLHAVDDKIDNLTTINPYACVDLLQQNNFCSSKSITSSIPAIPKESITLFENWT